MPTDPVTAVAVVALIRALSDIAMKIARGEEPTAEEHAFVTGARKAATGGLVATIDAALAEGRGEQPDE